MKFMVGMVAMMVTATWCLSSAAAEPSNETSAVSATKAVSTTKAVPAANVAAPSSSGESMQHKTFAKNLADIQKALDDIKDLEDKQKDMETSINAQIKNLKERDAKNKMNPLTDAQMTQELKAGNPTPAAIKDKNLHKQIISIRLAIAQKLGPGGGLYGKCQDLASIDPKDDDLKAQAKELTQKILTKYEIVLQGIAPLYEVLNDTQDEDGIYRQIKTVDPNNPAVAAYFTAKAKKAAAQAAK